MSWFVHNMQTRRRAELIRKGQSPHRDAPPVYDREIASLAMGTRLDTGPQPDLAALAMGVRQDDARTVARKAEPVEHVSAAIALDGVIGRERVMKAFNPPIRSDADATAHEHGKLPAPPTNATTTLDASILNTLRQAGFNEAQIAEFAARQAKPGGAVLKAEHTAAEVQKAINDSMLYFRTNPTIIKKAQSRPADNLDHALTRLFGRAA